MKITTSAKDENNIITITVETEAGHGKEAYSKTLRRLGESLNIKGFRKGKIPSKIVEQHYGVPAILANTLDNSFLSQLLNEAFKVKELAVITVSAVEKVEFNDPEGAITVEAKVELLPEIKLGNYKKLKATVEVPELNLEEQFQETLKQIKQKNTKFTESQEAVEMGDEIFFDFDGSYQAEDGSWIPKPGMKAENFQVIVESGRFIDNFLEQLVGMKPNEHKEIEVNFPENYHDEDLNGKPAKFKIKINKVSKPELPELNDEFAQTLGYENKAEMESKIREQLKGQAEEIRRNAASQVLLDELASKSEVGLSQGMIERELNNDFELLRRRNSWDDAKLQEFKTTVNMEEELSQTKEKLKRSLVLTQIIKEEKLESSQEDLQEAFARLNLPENFDFSKIDMQALMQQLNMDILSRKAIALLIDNADIKYKEVAHVHGPNCGHNH